MRVCHFGTGRTQGTPEQIPTCMVPQNGRAERGVSRWNHCAGNLIGTDTRGNRPARRPGWRRPREAEVPRRRPKEPRVPRDGRIATRPIGQVGAGHPTRRFGRTAAAAGVFPRAILRFSDGNRAQPGNRARGGIRQSRRGRADRELSKAGGSGYVPICGATSRWGSPSDGFPGTAGRLRSINCSGTKWRGDPSCFRERLTPARDRQERS